VTHIAPDLPGHDVWRRLGVERLRELHAGKQSRMFRASINGIDAAVKLTDAALADRAGLTARMHATERLAESCDLVVGPMSIRGELVNVIGSWLMTATPFVEGVHPVVTNVPDAQLMGSTLARLHVAMARLPSEHALPPVRALEPMAIDEDRSSWQMLHADFSNRNVLFANAGPRIFDFDECGHGPVGYDLGNSLYMVMFDADLRKRPADYETFRPAFLSGYHDEAKRTIDIATVDDMISLRINALARWLADPPSAPTGIRTSSADWLETLRVFVQSHQQDS
jgi:Ser/Thr protein kinase RdoA (MazF antagonist)